MLGTLALIASLGTFVLGILVAIKMFQHQMIWQGILTILCSIFGVIYGWSKKDEIGANGLMPIYTIFFLAAVILRVVATMQATHNGAAY